MTHSAAPGSLKPSAVPVTTSVGKTSVPAFHFQLTCGLQLFSCCSQHNQADGDGLVLDDVADGEVKRNHVIRTASAQQDDAAPPPRLPSRGSPDETVDELEFKR